MIAIFAINDYTIFHNFKNLLGSRLHQFSKVLDPNDPHKFRPLPKCPHHVWAKPRPINASSQFVQNMLDSKVCHLLYFVTHMYHCIVTD